MNNSEVNDSLRQTALDAFREDYDKLNDTWSSLENKAQGNVAIAGIFIAAAFAFIREISKDTYLYEKILLSSAIVGLVMAVILSIWALRIRLVAVPRLGENVQRLIDDLLRISDTTEFADRLPFFFNDRIAEWRIVNRAIDEANRVKASHLQRAQLFLLAAILIIAALVIARIFYSS